MIKNFINWFYGRRKPRLVTFGQITEQHPALTTGRLNWLRQSNPDFNACIKKIGKRVYVDLHAFNDWLDKQGSGK
jgi:hypothetical protein